MKKILLACLVITCSTASASDWSVAGGVKDITFVVIAPSKVADAEVYRMAAAKICKIDDKCKVWFWSDRAKVPSKFPMTNEQTYGVLAKYTYDRPRGGNDFVFDCQIVKGEKQCFGGRH